MFQVFWRLLKKRRLLSRINIKVKAFFIFVLLLWYAASGFLYFELPGKPDLGWLDALWWAMVTMATVGYGDLFPVTPAGRYVVGVPTMVFGIGFLGYLISEIAGSIIESRSKRVKGMVDIKAKNHILIINFSHVDKVVKLIRELASDRSTREREICLIDETLEEMPPELNVAGVHFVKGDPTRQEVLRRAGVMTASHVIILAKNPGDPHSDHQNLATTLVIESMNPQAFSVVEAVSAEKIGQLKIAGADSVVCAADISSGLIIQELQDPGVQNVIEDLVSDIGGHQIYFIPIRKLSQWEYGELVQWGLANRATVMGIVRDGAQMINCSATEKIRETDRAIVVAADRPDGITSPC
jgi:voltage-gated potassium channel